MTDEKKVPLGNPLPLSDADLYELARITDEDIKKAKKLWKKAAKPKLSDLLEAKESE